MLNKPYPSFKFLIKDSVLHLYEDIKIQVQSLIFLNEFTCG